MLILKSGHFIPAVGMGTYRLKGDNVKNAIRDAIELGYRMFDTASVYRNEEEIGEVLGEFIKIGKLRREDLFITTKIGPKDQGEDKAYKAVLESLRKLGPEIGYLDLVLIHWPGTQGLKLNSPRNPENRLGSWRALEKLFNEKLALSIGVSNFNIQHLTHLLQFSQITPHVNQIELHLLYQQDEMRLFCRSQDILVQAYSLFGEGRLLDGTIVMEDLKAIATKHEREISQVLLRWALQLDCCVIPKASSKERLKENFDCFGFTLDEEKLLAKRNSAGILPPLFDDAIKGILDNCQNL
ncbi:hypothetical protein HK096_003388 [Nowakowskiella sp. JEL0078]|nr:hypothetical protein HK096_003388 [Nowakowskiella sp. JEL0078]